MALPKQSDSIIRDDDEEFEENNSISEHISVDSNVESDSAQLNVNIKKRQLFGMDTSDSFKDDDLLNDMLTGENIAKHFVIEDKGQSEILESKESGGVDKSSDAKPSISVQQEQLVESISKLKDLSEKKIQIKIRKEDDDSKVESLNVKLDVRERSSKIDLMKSPSQKEISPLQEDVILLNNEKVSIDSLKNLVHDDHSFNTTNDVSDIGADDNSLSGLLSEGKQELIKDKNTDDLVVSAEDDRATKEPFDDPAKSDDSFEEDHSIEEILVSNTSYNLDSDSKIKLQEIQPSELYQGHTNNANVKKILDQTIDDLPSEIFDNKNDPDSLDSLSAEMDRILRDTVDDLPEDIFDGNPIPKFSQNSNIIDQANDPDSLENVPEKIHNILSDTINKLPIGESSHSKGSYSNDFIKEEISEILKKTVDELPFTEPDSLEYSDGIIDIKDKIKEKMLSIEPTKTKTHQQIVEEIEIEDSPPVVIKSMEKCNYVKEMLDDITEESDMSLEPKVNATNTPLTSTQIQDKGSEIRKILETNYKPDIIFPVSPYLADFAQNEQQANSFDSVVSLNMLQLMENKVKELEEIVAGKDVCLAALNMQLDSRRNSIKDVLPSARDSYSLATVSTEYRTYQDEYVNRVSSDNFPFNSHSK